MSDLQHGRTHADRASHKVALAYKEHDVLRSFPIPRLTFKQVDIEARFAVAHATRLDGLLREPELQENFLARFRHQLDEALEKFRATREDALAKMWDDGQPGAELCASVRRILALGGDVDTLVHLLAMTIENFLYQASRSQHSPELLTALAQVWGEKPAESAASPPANAPAPVTDPLRGSVTNMVYGILGQVLPNNLASYADPSDICVIVEAAELEAQRPENMQTVRVSFQCEDRKWMASTQNGEKHYILG